MEIKKHFSDYIKENNLSKDNLDKQLQSIGYIHFFNSLTVTCLGEPEFTHDKYNETSSSLLYVPESTKELLIPSLDIIHISTLYIGIMTNSEIRYNYGNYKEFLIEILELRKQIKKDFYHNNDMHDETIQQLMKMYLNIVYGMIDKADSVLTVDMNNPRKYIVETSKKIMATVVSFYLNRSLPIYHINTDEIFAKHISTDEINELKKYYEYMCKDLINLNISKLEIDENEYGMIGMVIGQKKFWVSKDIRVVGIKLVDDRSVLSNNKQYFGKNFREIFPEYTL